jgi:hypothetical protein
MYLARAAIWHEPGALSPEDMLTGPAGAFPEASDQADSEEGIGCVFTQPTRDLGGNSPKFLCRTADGRDLRLKYWAPESRTSNREVFTTVAASRILWALGFNAIPTLPITVKCDNCPENPMKGSGVRATRRYAAILQARWPTPILSTADVDQGWSWRELDAAIRGLPPGPERSRQRTHFDALALFGVFIQHGDRKPEQQRLYCAGAIATAAGEAAPVSGNTPPMLLERPDASACASAAVAIVDVGATFGGAGRTSRASTAKMNLDAWQRQPVFKDTRDGACHGNLTVSLKAGGDGEPDPFISEEGRAFLSERLHRLTPDHIRVIFTAARVDQMREPQRTTGVVAGTEIVDAWTRIFQDKVRQIDARRCQPAS